MKTTLVVGLLLLAATASASEIEDIGQQVDPSFHYQEDGGVPGDAPDTCEEVEPERALEPDSNISAIMVQEDDESDVFAIPLATEVVGDRMRLSILPAFDADLYEFDFDILDQDCGYSIFNESAPIYDPARNAPSQPIQPGIGEKVHEFDATGAYACEPSEWKMLIKHAQGLWPEEIYVQWTDGSYAYVPASDQGRSSQVAKYITSHNLENHIEKIQAAMPIWWSGELSIAHGPCELSDPEPIPKPTQDKLSGEFTVVENTTYVLHIYISKDAVQTVQEEVDETIAPLLDPLSPQPASCHHRGCRALLTELASDISLDNLSTA